MNVLSPFLGKAETLLVLLVVLLLSVAWLLWEIFSYAQGESEEANHDWWEALKSCPHRRLIIPVRALPGSTAPCIPEGAVCTWPRPVELIQPHVTPPPP